MVAISLVLLFNLFIALLLFKLLMTLLCFGVLLAMLHCLCLGSGVQPVPAPGTQTSSGWYPSGYRRVLVGAAQPEPAVGAPRVSSAGAWGSFPLATLSHFNLLSHSCFPCGPFRVFSCPPFLAGGLASISSAAMQAFVPSLLSPHPIVLRYPRKGGCKASSPGQKRFKEQNLGLIFALQSCHSSGQADSGEELGPVPAATLGAPSGFSILKSGVLLRWRGPPPEALEPPCSGCRLSALQAATRFN